MKLGRWVQIPYDTPNAHIVQWEERILGKNEVVSSILTVGFGFVTQW